MTQQNDRRLLRRVLRPLGLGFFSGLLALAIGIAVMSFLTACKCMEPFVPKSP
jgi:hypothetical protein